jgi:histidinol phosphatase-like PHP family hydrolase
VDDEQQFMDDLVSLIVKIMSTEPIDMYVNPTYLPECISEHYNQLWTEQRMLKVIEAAKINHIAIEINNRFKIPSEHFILLAKQNGIKFTIGTNNVDSNFSGASYAIEMISRCKLSESDFFLPDKKLRN